MQFQSRVLHTIELLADDAERIGALLESVESEMEQLADEHEGELRIFFVKERLHDALSRISQLSDSLKEFQEEHQTIEGEPPAS